MINHGRPRNPNGHTDEIYGITRSSPSPRGSRKSISGCGERNGAGRVTYPWCPAFGWLDPIQLHKIKEFCFTKLLTSRLNSSGLRIQELANAFESRAVAKPVRYTDPPPSQEQVNEKVLGGAQACYFLKLSRCWPREHHPPSEIVHLPLGLGLLNPELPRLEAEAQRARGAYPGRVWTRDESTVVSLPAKGPPTALPVPSLPCDL